VRSGRQYGATNRFISYVVSLVVNDGLVDSDPDTVTISVTSRQDQVVQKIRLDNLQEDVLGKTNGCMGINQLPDKNDWILNCTAQGQVATPITQAIKSAVVVPPIGCVLNWLVTEVESIESVKSALLASTWMVPPHPGTL